MFGLRRGAGYAEFESSGAARSVSSDLSGVFSAFRRFSGGFSAVRENPRFRSAGSVFRHYDEPSQALRASSPGGRAETGTALSGAARQLSQGESRDGNYVTFPAVGK